MEKTFLLLGIVTAYCLCFVSPSKAQTSNDSDFDAEPEAADEDAGMEEWHLVDEDGQTAENEEDSSGEEWDAKEEDGSEEDTAENTRANKPYSVPSSAKRLRVSVGGYFGLAGDLESEAGDLSATSDLDPTLGIWTRLEGPLHSFFVLGGQLAALFWQPKNNASDERGRLIDISLYPKGRFPYQLEKAAGEVYAMLPVGFSASIIPDADIDGVKTFGAGWHIGLLFGVQHFFTDSFGGLFELGWMRHAATHKDDGFGGPDIEFSFNQFVLNVGIVVLL